MLIAFLLPSLDNKIPIGFIVCGFAVHLSIPYTPSLYRNKLTGFLVSWFRGFMVSCNPSLDSKMLIGFMFVWFHTLSLHALQRSTGFLLSWFHGFVLFISGQQDADRFHGFVHSISGQRDVGRFLDFNILLSRIGVHGEINHETTKPIIISMSRDGVHKTMKS